MFEQVAIGKYNYETGFVIGQQEVGPNELVIHGCDLIKLHHKDLEFTFDFTDEKLRKIDTIIINGHKFVREK